jgi:hypothetical protein
MAFLIIDILVITFVRKWLERAAARKKDASGRKGLASLILGIAGLLLFVVPYVGLLLSGLALVYARAQKTAKPTKPATAGYILGIIGVSLNVLLLAFVLFVVLR